MLKMGTRVKLRAPTHEGAQQKEVLGTVVYTYPPSVYENRLYEVQWDGESAASLVERKNNHFPDTQHEEPDRETSQRKGPTDHGTFDHQRKMG